MSKIVVCIPTEFDSRTALARALESRYGTDYVFIGRVFKSTVTGEGCEMEISDREPDLATDFESGRDKISAATIQHLNRHRQVIYLISRDTGHDVCQQMAKFTKILLNAGGIAVKVASAGVFWEKAEWLERQDSEDIFDLYRLFVGLVETDDIYYSCGMHDFAKADVAIAISEDIGLAIYVMNVFNYYRLTESPILQDGHTFQPDIESPVYRLEWMADREYAPDSWQHNIHGRWYLSRI